MSIVIGDESPVVPTGQIVTQDPLLTLTGLDLLMAKPDPVTGWRIRAVRENFTLGDPDEVVMAIVSQLQDGDLERVDRAGNRVANVPLMIDAPRSARPGAVIAQAQAAVDAACTFDGWTELAWRSELAGSETSIFEVTSASVSTPFSDVVEKFAGARYVTLTIRARPFVRGATPVTIDAPPVAGSTTTTVDDGSSAAGWSMLSTRPDALRNLVANPSFEADASGWGDGSGTSQIFVESYFGDEGLAGAGNKKLFVDASGTPPRSYVNSSSIPVQPAAQYQIIAHINGRGSSGGSGGYANYVGVLYRFYNAKGAQIGSDRELHGSAVAWNSGRMVKVAAAVTAPAGAVSMRAYPFVNYTSGLFLAGWNLDAVLVGPVSVLGANYFDGNTPDTAALAYSWDGTANKSTSTATWTAPSLAAVSGGIRGTIYGRPAVTIRRAGAIGDPALPYVRIKGVASAFSDGMVIVNDDGPNPSDVDPSGYSYLTPASYTYNRTTGEFELLFRPSNFNTVDVTFLRTSGSISTTSGLFVQVDSIEMTDNPFGTGKVQSRQVQIYGSQRTELSLEVLGLNEDGTSPVGLGEQVLVHTAAAGNDGRAKFLSARNASALVGTPDASATGGVYNALGTTSSPTAFTFPAATLLPGNYVAYGRLRHSAVANATVSLRGEVQAATETFTDPRTGWKTAPVTVLAAGATWPQLNANTWEILPLGMLRLPPADIEQPDATITIAVACDTALALDDIFLCNADVGQASLLLTTTAEGTSFNAARLDAATVDAPQASAWVGWFPSGAMVADAARWIGEQHQASPGLLQIGTVTPGCATSRVSGSYYPRNHTNYTSADQVAS